MKKILLIGFLILLLIFVYGIKRENKLNDKKNIKPETLIEAMSEATTEDITQPKIDKTNEEIDILGTWRVEKVALKSVYLKNENIGETDNEYVGKEIEFAEDYIRLEKNIYKNLHYYYYKTNISDFNFENRFARTVLGKKPYVEKVDNLGDLIQKDNIKVKYIDDFDSISAVKVNSGSDDNDLPDIFQNLVVLNDDTMITNNAQIFLLIKRER